jgi:hypothetical protein
VTRARCQRFPFCAADAGHPGDCEIRPQVGYQEEIAACGADGALGGGAVGAGKSLFFSFIASWRNWRAFTMYGVALAVIGTFPVGK